MHLASSVSFFAHAALVVWLAARMAAPIPVSEPPEYEIALLDEAEEVATPETVIPPEPRPSPPPQIEANPEPMAEPVPDSVPQPPPEPVTEPQPAPVEPPVVKTPPPLPPKRPVPRLAKPVKAPPATVTLPPVDAQASPASAPAAQIEAPRPTAPSPTYTATLRAWLEKHKDYPRRARVDRIEGTAVLRFTINADGRVLRHRIERSSGFAVLDDAVEAMITRASPLPAMPDERSGDELTLVVPITFALR